ncbi:MAG TPA: DUF6600 domain-containing protein [Micropepsaceae bacterium]|nr:DUF6600 domain-containing protein [Micropepsaceae bacterium]
MILISRLCGAAALLALSVAVADAQPAQAPPGVQRPATDVDLAYFEQRLSSFGRWISHPAWGEVWQPDSGREFRPYFYGYWQFTSDYGWLWVSNEPFGDIVYHYGRWVYDPNFGWLWVPGYVWGPSWVAWRETDDYIGWLPMPPGYEDFSLPSAAPAYGPDQLYGYQNFYGSNFPPDAFAGLWVFVPTRDFGRNDRRRYVFDRDRVRDLYRHSQDRTHYVHDRDHDRIVDRSIDKDALERATHRHFDAPQGRQFLRSDTPQVSVTQGQETARRDRDRTRAGAPESPQSGAVLRGSGRPGARQPGLGQNGAAPNAGAQNPAQIPSTPPRRGFGAASERNLPAAAGNPNPSPAIAPPTEFSRGLRDRPAPPSLPQIQSGANAPGGAAGRTNPRGFGVNPAPPVSAPGVVLSAPPLTVRPPAAPVVPSVRAAPPAPTPAPAAAAPQSVPRRNPREAGNGGS